jgi:hypothetical protein
MTRREQLLARRARLIRLLPPLDHVLRGSFLVRVRRCGKSACRCVDGPGHRTAYVSVTFADGSTKQVSLPRALEPVARSWVHNYQRWWDTLERISGINRELLQRRLVAPETPSRPRR